METGSLEVLLAKLSQIRDRQADRKHQPTKASCQATSDALRQALKRCNLSLEELMNNNSELIFTKASAGDLLTFLNKDRLRDILTNYPFDVESTTTGPKDQ